MTSEDNIKYYAQEFKQLMRSSRLIKSRFITQSVSLKEEGDGHARPTCWKTHSQI